MLAETGGTLRFENDRLVLPVSSLIQCKVVIQKSLRKFKDETVLFNFALRTTLRFLHQRFASSSYSSFGTRASKKSYDLTAALEVLEDPLVN